MLSRLNADIHNAARRLRGAGVLAAFVATRRAGITDPGIALRGQ